MIDFLMISTRSTKRGVIEIYPKFIIKKSSDLMIRGGDFYAIWIEERGLWSTDEQDALQLIDRELDRYAEENRRRFDSDIKVLHMWDAESGMIDSWHKYCQKQMRDSFHMLDEKLIFSNTETNKKDYASKKLNYPLEAGDLSAYEKLMSTLYSEEERQKIEWAIGSIVSGESKRLQKFMVLYGAAGTGKSTVLNIIQQLFEGYYSVFDAKALGSSSNSFALEAFKSNPLVAIQHDGDLSRIEDNTRLNSLVSHELMTVNEKFKSTYSNRFKCFLFMGTNKPVKITDAKSGLIRRLIDVSPTGNKLNPNDYKDIVKRVGFELGAIAYHCQEVYLSAPGMYDDYGLTSASFENAFRDPRNKDNIVAKRGALFMINLKHEVQERGFTVAHIKTDSIKIPDATPEIIQFVMDYGKRYGYTFEHEATYDRMCLVNDAVYIAKYKDGKHAGEWTATGTQFAVPYVFKKLFSGEDIAFEDMCETKSVSSALYLDMNEGLPDVSEHEKTFSKAESDYKKGLLSDTTFEATCDELRPQIEEGHNYRFIGKIGQFCPIKDGCGGGLLMREKNGRYYAATGSKGYRWLESEMVRELDKQDDIDRSYYDKLVDDAVKTISEYGDFEWFVSEDPYIKELGANDADVDSEVPPWMPPCGEMKYATCFDCPNFHNDKFHMDCNLGYDISDVIMSHSMNPPEDDPDEEYLPF